MRCACFVSLDLPDEVRVHEFCSDGSQDLVVAVLHQAQLASVKYHAHLKHTQVVAKPESLVGGSYVLLNYWPSVRFGTAVELMGKTSR